MKKLFILSLFALASIAANAQLVKSRTFAKEESNTTWYTRLGLSFNNVTGYVTEQADEDGESYGSKVGYDISFGFQKPIRHSNIYWGMDLGLGTRGFSNSYTSGQEEAKDKLITHNVKFSPLTFGYKRSITDMISIDLHVGGYVSYDYAGTLKSSWGSSEEKTNIDDLDWYPLDSGIAAGIGAWYDRFNLELTYQRGFLNCFDEDNDSSYSSNFMIRLGVAF